MTLDVALVLVRWLFLAASTACFGLALFPFYAFPPGDRPPGGADRLMVAAASLALFAAFAWLGLAVVTFGGRDLASFGGTLGTVLFATSFGPAWLLRLVAALALLLVARLSPRPFVILALATAVLGTEARIGHAAAHGWPYEVVQVAHLLAAGTWLGGLLALLRLLYGGVTEDRAAGLLLRFSAIGILSVVTIAATGALSTWFMLGRTPSLLGTYDRLVLVKIALFLAMLLAAAYNRFRLLPLLARRSEALQPLQRLKRSILVEQGLGASVLLVASVLGMTDPSS